VSKLNNVSGYLEIPKSIAGDTKRPCGLHVARGSRVLRPLV